jgi:hypothetical protein
MLAEPAKETGHMPVNASPISPALMLMDFQPAVLMLIPDATADPDPEVHRVLTEKVFPGQADVIETGDLPALAVASRAA